MERLTDMTDWMNSNRVMAICAFLAVFVPIVIFILQTRSSNRTVKASHLAQIAKITPKVTISVVNRAAFSDGQYLEPGPNFRYKHPPPLEHPRLLLFISVKNEGEAPVKIKRMGVQVHDRFDDFQGEDLSDYHLFPRLPLNIEGFDEIEYYVDPLEVKGLLQALHASVDSSYTIEVIDAIDRHYSSSPLSARKQLEESGSFTAELRIHPTIVVTNWDDAEERFYPEGFFPAGCDQELERDRQK